MAIINGRNDRDDTLVDTADDDQISGFGGNDSLKVTGGRDTADGGAGTDTLIIDYSGVLNDVVTNNAPAASGSGFGGFDGSFFCYNGWQVSYGSIDKFDITTGVGNDAITTASGDDVVKTGAGNDTVNVGSGKDSADGGADIDIISADLSAMTTAIIWNLQSNSFTGLQRSFKNFEEFGTVSGGSAADTLVSGSGAYNETINGNGGDDTITVLGGTDTVNGGAGGDTLVVDYGSVINDVVTNNGPAASGTGFGGYDGSYYCYNGSSVSYNSIEKFTITTGSGNDSILTANGNDAVKSGDGNDFVNVGSGTDAADGGAGSDTISTDFSGLNTAISWNLQTNSFTGKGSFKNFEAFGTISGGKLADTFVSGAGGAGETINGNEGDDSIAVFGGADGVNGGAGSDTLVIDYGLYANDIVTNAAPAASGTGFGGFDGAYYCYNGFSVGYSSIDRFFITAGSGNDSITTATGDDIVNGGAGNDTINVGIGKDSADGGTDYDRISTDLSAITTAIIWDLQTNAFSGAGAGRSFKNFEAFGTLNTGSGNDTVVSGKGGAGESITTGAGNDKVTVFDGNDSVVFGAGNDILVVDYSTATNSVVNNSGPSANGADGEFDGSFYNYTDGASVGYSSAGTFIITAGSGNDTITTLTGSDVVKLGAGDDGVNVGTGADTADGGDGIDGISADLRDATGAIVWNLATNVFSGGPDSFTNFEYFGVIATGGGNDVITTGAISANESVDTGGGGDTFTTVNGNDGFTAGAGADTLIVDYGAATSSVVTNGGPTANSTDGEFDGSYYNYTNGASIGYSSVGTFVITTGSGNDTITTAEGDDTITTGAGIDTVSGGAGNDRIDGGTGDDVMAGGAGADVYVVDSSGDTVTEAADAGIDEIRTALTSYSLAALPDVEELTGTSAAGQTLTGNAANNLITGAAGVDTIDGGDGRDVLVSGAGADSLTGGQGEDLLISGTLGGVNLVRNGGFETQDGTNRSLDYVRAEPADYNGATYHFASALDGWRSATGVGFELNIAGSNPGFSPGDGSAAIDLEINPGQNVTLFQDIVGIVPATELLLTFAAARGTGGSIGTDPTGVLQVVWNGQVIGTITPASTTMEQYAFAVSASAAGTGDRGANRLEFREIGAGSDARGTILDAVSLQAITLDGQRDTMTGGSEDDVYVVGNNDVVTEASGGGVDLVRSNVSYTLSQNLEKLALIGAGAIDGTGNAGANVITGNDAANTLDGKAGADALAGLGGNDVYVVDDAGDTVTEAANGGIDLVRAAVSFALGADVENLTLTGTSAIDGSGNALANTITGNDAANTLDGKAGADALAGMGGDDNYVVDDAGDTVTEAAGAGNDTVRSSVSVTLGANLENLLLTGADAIDATGNGLANMLAGNDAANTLDGKAGIDRMAGMGGNDTYVVDATGDVVTESAGGGIDRVLASASYTLADQVETLTLTGTAAIDGTGNGAANTIIGNGAANTIEGAGGDDVLDGGAGVDTAGYAGAANGVTVSLAATGAQATGAGSDTLLNFEALLGSGFADALTGNAGANTLTGGNGDDTLSGGGAADRLIGGSGNDTALYSGGFADYDVVQAGGGFTVADRRGGAPDGTDTLTSVEKVTLSSGSFAIGDVVNKGPTANADTVGGVVEAGRDTGGTPGASGNVLANDTDPNLLTAGLGERLSVTGARAGNGGGFTTVSGATVVDGLYGTLTIAADGSYSYALDDTRAATDRLAPGETAQDVFSYMIADLHGAASQATLMVAITGSDDTVARDDTLQVTTGRASSLDAAVLIANDMGAIGESLSVVSVSNVQGGTVALVDGRLVITATKPGGGGFDYVVQSAGGGTASGHVDFTAIAATRRIDATAPDGITAVDYVGGGQADSLTGSDGDDRLVGNAGKDLLDGGAGVDRMEGGSGSDTYHVDSAGDRVIEAAVLGTDTVLTVLAAYTLGDNVENLTFVGVGEFGGTGNALRNAITGGAGSDTLFGGDNADKLIGGAGDDRLDGGAGFDTVSYFGTAGGATVDLRMTGPQDTGNGGHDTLASIENLTGSNGSDTFNGTDAANILNGGASKDVLFGNGGNDQLAGGTGGDTVTGGGGADTFVFRALAEIVGGDRIADFSHAQGDTIDFSKLDADLTLAGRQSFTFIGTDAFTGASGSDYELRYVASTGGDLIVQGDTDHDGVADVSFIVHATALQASDFTLI